MEPAYQARERSAQPTPPDSPQSTAMSAIDRWPNSWRLISLAGFWAGWSLVSSRDPCGRGCHCSWRSGPARPSPSTRLSRVTEVEAGGRPAARCFRLRSNWGRYCRAVVGIEADAPLEVPSESWIGRRRRSRWTCASRGRTGGSALARNRSAAIRSARARQWSALATGRLGRPL